MFTDQQLLEQVQNTMMEPPDGGTTWPSDLWTAAEVVNYANQRQQRFLKDTHLQIGIANIPGVAGTITYNLPDDWVTTVRVVWVESDGSTRALTASDSWEADYGIPTWTYVAGTPKLYMDVDTAVLTLKIAPLPVADGTIQIHYVPLAGALDGNGELICLPDEYVPSLKYGILADMFSKVGRANDQSRADYCQQRYQLGLDVCRMLLKGWKD
jgi:hypothetical protein